MFKRLRDRLFGCRNSQQSTQEDQQQGEAREDTPLQVSGKRDRGTDGENVPAATGTSRGPTNPSAMPVVGSAPSQPVGVIPPSRPPAKVAVAEKPLDKPFDTNSFRLVGPALIELHKCLSDTYQSRTLSLVRHALQKLRGSFGQDDKIIDYRGDLTRFAYLYTYAPGRASVLCRIMAESAGIRQLLSKPEVRLLSVGGGPGTDILGVLRLRVQEGSRAQVHAVIIDEEEGWETCWRTIELTCGPWPYADVTYHICNAHDPAATVPHRFTPTLITISYCISELATGIDEAKVFLRRVVRAAERGAYFVIVDNGDKRFPGRRRVLTGANPFPFQQLVEWLSDSEGLLKKDWMLYREMRVEDNEWQTALYCRQKFGLHEEIDEFKALPHRNYKLAYWILQKP